MNECSKSQYRVVCAGSFSSMLWACLLGDSFAASNVGIVETEWARCLIHYVKPVA